MSCTMAYHYIHVCFPSMRGKLKANHIFIYNCCHQSPQTFGFNQLACSLEAWDCMNFRCAFDSSSASSRRLSQIKCLGSKGRVLSYQASYYFSQGFKWWFGSAGIPGYHWLGLPTWDSKASKSASCWSSSWEAWDNWIDTIIIMINLFLFSALIVLPRYPNYETQMNMRQLACTCTPIIYGLLQLFFCSR